MDDYSNPACVSCFAKGPFLFLIRVLLFYGATIQTILIFVI